MNSFLSAITLVRAMWMRPIVRLTSALELAVLIKGVFAYEHTLGMKATRVLPLFSNQNFNVPAIKQGFGIYSYYWKQYFFCWQDYITFRQNDTKQMLKVNQITISKQCWLDMLLTTWKLLRNFIILMWFKYLFYFG